MQDRAVGVAFARSRLDLAHERAAVGKRDAHLRADGIAVDGRAVAEQMHLEPVARLGRGVHEEPARGHEIEPPVAVEVRPGGLVGRRQVLKAGAGGDVLEHPRLARDRIAAEEHGEVLLAEARVGIDRREEEVEVAVVVEVAARGARVALLVRDAALVHVVEGELLGGTPVSQEAALGLVAARVDMREIAGEEVDVAVAIEVAKARADRVAAREAVAGRERVALGGLVGELRVAVVDEERVRLQAVVRRVDVEVAVFVEVAGGDPARAAFGRARRERERLAVVVQEQERRECRLGFPVLEAADEDVDKTVVVEVADGGAAGDGRRQVGRKAGDRHASHRAALGRAVAHAAQDPRRRKRHQVAHSVVVDVRDHARARRVDARKALAFVVDPQHAAHPEVGPAVAVHIAPCGVLAAAGDAEFRSAIDENLRECVPCKQECDKRGASSGDWTHAHRLQRDGLRVDLCRVHTDYPPSSAHRRIAMLGYRR